MSQLANAPLRTAKQLQKLKEIRKVKAAIRWHERDRTRRQKLKHEAWESKQTVFSLLKFEKENGLDVRRRALRHARQDWRLGPLRPNRAVGYHADKYGALTPEGIRRPDIPVRVQKNRNEVRERRGLEPEYPIVARAFNSDADRKFFHIVSDDRVVVIKGREKDKIGVVAEVFQDTHEVIIRDLNKAYSDSSIYRGVDKDKPKHEAEHPIPLSDVRLVIPYRITTENAEGAPKDIYQDVIVDHIIMERHTKGVDPFTGIDYGNDEFPEEHRYDPDTELPIFNRYIAGTKRRIPWPWEKDETIDQHKQDKPVFEEKKTWRERVRAPRKMFSEWTNKVKPKREKVETEIEKQEMEAKELEQITSDIETAQKPSKGDEKPKSQPQNKPPDFDDDTSRNKAEPGEETSSFYPTLVYPPFPNELSTELAPHIREKMWADAKDKSRTNTVLSAIERERAQKELARAEKEKRQLDAMKTPMQLRWEIERAKQKQEKPKAETYALMLALGQHMQAKGIKLTQKRARAAAKAEKKTEVEEVD